MRNLMLSVCLLLLTTVASAASPQLVTNKEHGEYAKMIRQTQYKKLIALLDKDIIFYTSREMPPTYQDWDDGSQGIFRVASSNSTNANEEFPWKSTAGLTDQSNAGVVKFMVLPEGGKIRWWKERIPAYVVDVGDDAFVWKYPKGTIFGEIITVQSPSGKELVFEVRTRTKKSDDYNKPWRPQQLRPFPTAGLLIKRIKEIDPNWAFEKDLSVLITHLEKSGRGKTMRLSDSAHTKRAFDQLALVDKLPPISEEMVEKLLTTTPFRSMLSYEWASKDGVAGYAPDTDADFHIVPKHNNLAFLQLTTKSCMRCHSGTLNHSEEFDKGRDWYGYVRGSDGIFSFNPVFGAYSKRLSAAGKLDPPLHNAMEAEFGDGNGDYYSRRRVFRRRR